MPKSTPSINTTLCFLSKPNQNQLAFFLIKLFRFCSSRPPQIFLKIPPSKSYVTPLESFGHQKVDWNLF